MIDTSSKYSNLSGDVKNYKIKNQSVILKRTRFIKPLFFIGGFNGGTIIEAILLKFGWKRIFDKSSDNYTLRWTERLTQINFYKVKPDMHLVNHIPNCGILTNKLGMLLSLRSYEKFCQDTQRQVQFQMCDFIPQTYIIDDFEEQNIFFNEFVDGVIWICKPCSSNQGKGITLIRDIKKIQDEFLRNDINSKLMISCDIRIVQKYISNPLLIEGRKFDIRCYMLIASTLPYLVLFHPGYIRLSMNLYSNNDENLITHLTNQFIQKQSPKYNDLKESTIWTFDSFNNYFNQKCRNLENFKLNWVDNDLMITLKSIILHLFKSVKQKLANSISFFELYGLDFLIDSNLKVWLIEANSNPSMSLDCSILKEIIPNVLEETLMIALECFEKNCKLDQPLLPLNNIKNFQIIYSENSKSRQSGKSLHGSFLRWSAPRFDYFKLFTGEKLEKIEKMPNLKELSIISKPNQLSGDHKSQRKSHVRNFTSYNRAESHKQFVVPRFSKEDYEPPVKKILHKSQPN